jgi:hypothetical protein
VSNCKPSLLNVLPLPVGLHFEQIKSFEPIFRGPLGASQIQENTSAISGGPAILGTGLAIKPTVEAINQVGSSGNTDNPSAPSAGSSGRGK